jgi:hypothetical protein
MRHWTNISTAYLFRQTVVVRLKARICHLQRELARNGHPGSDALALCTWRQIPPAAMNRRGRALTRAAQDGCPCNSPHANPSESPGDSSWARLREGNAGWGCGAQLIGRNMRAHFTMCSERPAASEHVDRRGRNAQAKRGRPPGPRMPCGWGSSAEPTGHQMRTTSRHARGPGSLYPRGQPRKVLDG